MQRWSLYQSRWSFYQNLDIVISLIANANFQISCNNHHGQNPVFVLFDSHWQKCEGAFLHNVDVQDLWTLYLGRCPNWSLKLCSEHLTILYQLYFHGSMVSSASTEPTIPGSVLTDLGNWSHRSFGTFGCTKTKGYLGRTRRVVQLKSWQGVLKCPLYSGRAVMPCCQGITQHIILNSCTGFAWSYGSSHCSPY